MRADVEEPSARHRVVDRVRGALRFSAVEIGVLAVLALLVIGGASLAWVRSRPIALSQAPAALVAPDASPSGSAVAAPAGSTIIVHVVGAVRSPGVYELPAGARGIDAVRAAGGLGPHADALAVNLARALVDGEQLIVPRVAAASAEATEASGSGTSATDKVNINTADLAALDALPGIGPTIAQRIIDHREANGPFRTIEGLIDVSGIGEKTLADLEPFVTV
jgi:competence protein ComEA